jgi:glycosyltransferase involved in cell wall biosynthesis
MNVSLPGKKVIIVLPGSELGGAERQGLQLARYLKEVQNSDVSILGLCAEKRGRVTNLSEEYLIPWQGVPFCWSDRHIVRLKEIFKFALRLRQEKPDILLPYTWLPNIVCGLVWKFVGARLCVWNQRDEGRYLSKELWHRTAVQWTPCHVSNSEIGKTFLMRTYGLHDQQINVIRNAIVMDTPVLNKVMWRQRIGVSEKAFVACMVANLHNHKDHVTLLKAWQVVHNREPAAKISPVLCLAGRFDGAEVQLEAMARDLRIESSVRFLGAVDDISGLLAAIDLCVHSSKTEGAPNAIIEAMACNLPVVASDIPGIREIIGPDSYVLVPVGDHEALADRISELMTNTQTMQKLGDENYKRVRSLFDPARNMNAYSSLLNLKLSALEDS